MARVTAFASAALVAGHSSSSSSLLQTWNEARDTSKASPVARVVSLLTEMQSTLKTEMDEDAKLYDNLACWCNNNRYEKGLAISAAEAQIKDLQSSIDQLTASTEGAKVAIEQLNDEVAKNKQSLAEAEQLREKEVKEFKGNEGDLMQNIHAIRDAIAVLSKNAAAALPQLNFAWIRNGAEERTDLGALQISKTARGAFVQLRQRGKQRQPLWSADHESPMETSFDTFMEEHGTPQPKEENPDAQPRHFLSAAATHAEVNLAAVGGTASVESKPNWSTDDTTILQRGIKAATAFMQSQEKSTSFDYMASASAQSGEIIGILKQLKDQMEASLSEQQKSEIGAAASFATLHASKKKEIRAGEEQAEAKDDQLAADAMALAEAKEDIEHTRNTLTEDQKFMLNLRETCDGAGASFQERKKARLEELTAVGEAIHILTADEARDSFGRALGFTQLGAATRSEGRKKAAAFLRQVSKRSADPALSILATSVELDSFVKVKKAIDDMVAQLKVEQADEVKKHDWCISELQSNDMNMAQTQSKKETLVAETADLENQFTGLVDELKGLHTDVQRLTVTLQRASENRQAESVEFQHTVADQKATQVLILKALDKLRAFYASGEDFAQKSATAKATTKQTPPMAQKEYKRNAGAIGVMSMMEKVVEDSKALEADAVKGENEAQTMYEQLINDTNDSMAAFSRSIAEKTQAKAVAAKANAETEQDLYDIVDELKGLHKYGASMRSECEFLMKNFEARQDARGQEIQALLQAKQILSGASQ